MGPSRTALPVNDTQIQFSLGKEGTRHRPSSLQPPRGAGGPLPEGSRSLPRAEKEQQKAATSRQEKSQNAHRASAPHPTPCLRPGCPGHSRQGRCPQEEVPTGAIAAPLLLCCCPLTWAHVPLNSVPSTGDVCQGRNRCVLEVVTPLGRSRTVGGEGGSRAALKHRAGLADPAGPSSSVKGGVGIPAAASGSKEQ